MVALSKRVCELPKTAHRWGEGTRERVPGATQATMGLTLHVHELI